MVKIILSTGVVFLAIMAVRKFFRGRAGNVFLYSLWLLFAAGLIVPVFSAVLQGMTKGERGRLESPVSVMNLVREVSFDVSKPDISAWQFSAQQKEGMAGKGQEKQTGDAGKDIGKEAEKREGKEDAADRKTTGKLAENNGWFGWMKPRQLTYLLFFLWVAGAMAILLCQLLSERLFRRKLVENREEIHCQGHRVYRTKGIKTPLLFRGRGLSTDIYLPETIMENETLVRHAILHENVHRKHGDIWWGYVRNFLVALYWFYPLVWVSAFLSKRDCEYACDSSVMKRMDRKERISYGNSLLSLIQLGERQDLFCTATAMQMGKSEMEVRIRMIKEGKKRNIFVTVFVFLLLCVAGTVAFTDAMEPEKEPAKEQELSLQNEKKQPEQKSPEEEKPAQKEMLSAKEAEYELADLWGADLPYICYEDDKRMIFAGYFGLFVYSREKEEIVQSLNLKEIGCNMTQGDHYCEIDVSEDGKIVYLHVLRDKQMYQYFIDTNELQRLEYKLPDKLFNRKKWEKTHKSGIQSIRYATVGDLVYCHEEGDWIKYEPLFYKPYGSCEFWGPEDIRDLSEASFYMNGKEYVITEKGKLKWIEKHFSDSAVKIEGRPGCSFYRIMYLKREDGRCGKIFPATDSCAVYQAGEEFYDFREKTNEAFWKLFGIEDVDAIR